MHKYYKKCISIIILHLKNRIYLLLLEIVLTTSTVHHL